MRELRTVLHDDAKQPRFIETVPTRGYRFLPTVTAAPRVASSQYSVVRRRKKAWIGGLHPTTDHWQLTTSLIGREAELAALQQWWDKAQRGERQVVFVTGEPGIGKTTLVEAFLHSLESGVQSLASERVQGPKSRF